MTKSRRSGERVTLMYALPQLLHLVVKRMQSNLSGPRVPRALRAHGNVVGTP